MGEQFLVEASPRGAPVLVLVTRLRFGGRPKVQSTEKAVHRVSHLSLPSIFN